MVHAAPLLLYFDADIDEVERALRLLLTESATFNEDGCSQHSRNEISVLFEGITLILRVLPFDDERFECQRIFTNFDFVDARSILSLSLSHHVAGGQRVPPVARALLMAGAQIGRSLRAKAAFWSPADLLSDIDYFAEVVESYSAGGAFPVLPTIHFSFDPQQQLLTSSGLNWFTGQELKIMKEGEPVGQLELMKRAVRLVHDIAVNGPILQQQKVADIQSNNWITLSPNASADVVMVRIASDLDEVSLVEN